MLVVASARRGHGDIYHKPSWIAGAGRLGSGVRGQRHGMLVVHGYELGAVNGLPGNPLASQYQVDLQGMGTFNGTTTLCATVANTGDGNPMNDTWCEMLPWDAHDARCLTMERR